MKFNFLPQPQKIRETGEELPLPVLDKVEAAVGDGVATHPEGYRLEIGGSGVKIHAADDAGKFYAECTLGQIRQQAVRFGTVTAMVIDDYPAIPIRGLSLDMSRDRIPNMAELKRQLDQAARWKMNAVQLYFEHVFAYEGAEEVWKDATPFTVDDLRELREFCEARFMRIIPCQESFGHLHRWLRVDKFRPLAECPQGFPNGWALDDTDPFSLCPTDPKCIEFVDYMWGQLLPNFNSDMIHVGCDETADLGKGRSREACEKYGVSKVYLEFIKKLDELARNKYHKRIIVDADIFHLHPEVIPEIPRSIIIKDWGYRPDYDFDGYARQFHEKGVEFCLQSSNSSYTCFNGRTYRWRENINCLADAAVKYHAIGVFNSEWGDNGHWNELITAIPGDAYFAAMTWSPDTNREADLAGALDEFVFKPGSGAADLLMDCGRPYIHTAEPNASDLLWLFMMRDIYNLKTEPFDRLVTDEALFQTQCDLRDVLYRLERFPRNVFAPRDYLALTSHARWMLLAADVARECLKTGKSVGKELPLESRRGYAKRYDEILQDLLALRDDGTFRLGGRTEAVEWLKRFRNNLCGMDV